MNVQSVAPLLAPYADELLAFRRDLHAHPETGRKEVRTTSLIADRLEQAGLQPRQMRGTGLLCDLGVDGPLIALRGDIDALPLADETELDCASTVSGVSHACGHDVHTTALLGAGLVLGDLAAHGRLPGRVRLIFQPAEELMPGGALDVVAAGGLEGVERAYALHCDPHLDVGLVGSRVGAITAAADYVRIRLAGRGGHTSRPHLTEDVVFALGQLIVGLPAVLSRRIDPRAGAALVWGTVSAGSAANAIPPRGEVAGTFRCLDNEVWVEAGALIADAAQDLTRPYGVRADVEYVRGVPPTVNEAASVEILESAVRAELGPRSVELTPQSLGGEDFSWVLEKVPGAMCRLGTRTPGGRTYDLHRPDFTVDERAIAIGARVLAAIALRDLTQRA
ncbi:MAG TPA: amidohydrolase [Kineosporiaceae bacterium]|nr:amidohydrolase [Kineosporiaceae bacterium]